MNLQIYSSVITCLFILCAGWAYYLVDEIKKAKKKASENLSRPAKLEDAPKKLYSSQAGKEFVLQSFVPIKEQVNPKVMSEMHVGDGLLAHPEYPNFSLFFHILFKWGEEIHADGKTPYILKQDGVSHLYYLEKK